MAPGDTTVGSRPFPTAQRKKERRGLWPRCGARLWRASYFHPFACQLSTVLAGSTPPLGGVLHKRFAPSGDSCCARRCAEGVGTGNVSKISTACGASNRELPEKEQSAIRLDKCTVEPYT
jgi:hypothetical protein